MPPDKRSPRAAGGPAGAESEVAGGNRLSAIILADTADSSTADAPTPSDHDAAARQGMRRVTLGRSSSGRCHNCGRDFASLAGAVSHGRSAGHLVEARYSAAYLYVPTTDVGAA